MQTKLVDTKNLPDPIKLWLVDDTYDYQVNPNYISATTLLRPVKEIILQKRLQLTEGVVETEMSDLYARCVGTAIHNGIEEAWTKRLARNARKLNIPEKAIEKMKVNPTAEELEQGFMPIYMEQRATKNVGKYTIGGKFDMVLDGELFDFKTTGVFTYTNKTNDSKYALQGSIYRWLNPDKITSDHITICYLFKDWQATRVGTEGYPPNVCVGVQIPLLSIAETAQYVNHKIALIDKYLHASEDEIPECTEEDLWLKATYRYYANPAKMTRCTKKFDSMAEAAAYQRSKGNIGIIQADLKAGRCKYCSAAPICKQRLKYTVE